MGQCARTAAAAWPAARRGRRGLQRLPRRCRACYHALPCGWACSRASLLHPLLAASRRQRAPPTRCCRRRGARVLRWAPARRWQQLSACCAAPAACSRPRLPSRRAGAHARAPLARWGPAIGCGRAAGTLGPAGALHTARAAASSIDMAGRLRRLTTILGSPKAVQPSARRGRGRRAPPLPCFVPARVPAVAEGGARPLQAHAIAPSKPSCPLERAQSPCRRPRSEWQHQRQQVRPCARLASCKPLVGVTKHGRQPIGRPCGTAPLAGPAAAWPPVPTPASSRPCSQAAHPQQQHAHRGGSRSGERHAAAQWRRQALTTTLTTL